MNRNYIIFIVLVTCLVLAVPWVFPEREHTPSTADATEANVVEISVKKGDTLYAIAHRYNSTVSELQKANHLSNPAVIKIGQLLTVPRAAVATVSVQSKDSMAISKFPQLLRGKDLGHFKVTAYTAGFESTLKQPGDKGYGITSSGAQAREGLTIAVDPALIPMGSLVYIEGIGYRVAQDTGSAIKGKRIDLYMEDVGEARQFGVKQMKIEVVN